MERTLAQVIASLLLAMRNCEKSGNAEWLAKHRETIKTLCAEQLPRGSGFDQGTTLDFDRSKPDRLLFVAPFHAMDENGFYDGWRDYSVSVRASLVFGIEITVHGRDSNGLKDYVSETFQHALTRPYSEPQS